MIFILLTARAFGHAFLAVWRDPHAKALPVAAGSLVATGTIFHWHFEDWTIIESLYFYIGTLATVGDGDLSPTTPRNADLHDRLCPQRVRCARCLADLDGGAVHAAQAEVHRARATGFIDAVASQGKATERSTRVRRQVATVPDFRPL